MGVDVDTGGMPDRESVIQSVIDWMIGNGNFLAAIIVVVVTMSIVMALGGAIESIASRFKVATGITVITLVIFGYMKIVG